jgi:hypothetical protein
MRWLLVAFLMCTCGFALAQSMPAMEMPGKNNPHGMDSMSDEGASGAMHAMESHHLDMGPHMKMTEVRAMQPGDKARADAVVQSARAAATKYQDYKAALAEGYKIFLPNLPQKQYHFTNYWYAFRARNHFDASHPTSLLYEKNGDGYRLIGVMYTAKKTASEDDLNARIPLSIAQWHAHVNVCVPPKDKRQQALPPHAKYGILGSITTKQECNEAGGKFYPQIFGWMVHVYPFEQKTEDIWSVERQHNHTD